MEGFSDHVAASHKTMDKWHDFCRESRCYGLKQNVAFHLHTVFVPLDASHGSGQYDVRDFCGFVRPTFCGNISSTLFWSKVRTGVKSNCDCLTLSLPTKIAPSRHRSKWPSAFANISYYITVWQDYRMERKIASPMTSLKTSRAISLSAFFVLQ